MSRRTAPLYGGLQANEEQLERFLDAQQSPSCIFSALEMARFDAVRRAVAANPHSLRASNTPGNPPVLGGPPEHVHITPVDYGIDLCRLWESMRVHCERAGAVLGAPGYYNLCRRLATMSAIVEWLVTQPDAPLPSHTGLHTVILCNFARVARILVARAPALARTTDLRGKTPLHVCFKLTPRSSPPELLEYVRLLRNAGADPAAADLEGLTPMHELVLSLTNSQRAWGLARTRNYRASLSTLQDIVQFLVAEGADILAKDKRGLSPLDIAMREGLEYLVLVRSADRVFRFICRGGRRAVDLDTYFTDKTMGCFEILPYDIVLKIFTHLSPRDAVTGIGMTCKIMHAFATSRYVWERLSAAWCMGVARDAARQEVEKESDGEATV